MRHIAICVFSMLAAVTCESAFAARASGNTYHRASRCILDASPDFVQSWLVALPGSAEERAVLRQYEVQIKTCFGIFSDGTAEFSRYDYDFLRARIVRDLLQSKRDQLTTESPTGLMDSKWYVAHYEDTAKRNSAAIIINDVGFCLARERWVEVRNIILAVDPKFERLADVPSSADRREFAVVDEQLNAIVSAAPRCIDKGVKIALDRNQLRSLLEETALHAISNDAMPVANASSRRDRP